MKGIAGCKGPLLAAAFLSTSLAPAQTFKWGGSVRGYQFVRTESTVLPLPRRDTEFGSFRFTFEWKPHSRVRWETHAVADVLSPPVSGAASLAAGENPSFLPLQWDRAGDDARLVTRFDRLNLRLDLPGASVKVGRQAITWGVTYFWPVLDLFSNFAPQRIDRDYKEGVDAVRVTVPLGDYSEVQVVGAVLGDSLDRDGSLAVQGRFYLRKADVGLVAGNFHGDAVVGGFFSADLGGTGYRAEVAWTRSDELLDRALGRRSFWRASAGIDRQLTPQVTLVAELAYNGFGVGSPSLYPLIAQTDRVRRGEINALGTYYGGLSIGWQFHPLWTLSQSALVNWQDPSALWIPSLVWSSSDNTSVLLALQTGWGGEIGRDFSINSEYGTVPTTFFAAVKWYF